ncbi:MAG: FTR1 family protein [Gordonia sp. (in: high G+C Gram-positive bacteria)]
MLATLIIGLREGLEASLIVGIIAAFLNRQSRSDLLRWMWLGVGVAIAICVGVAIGLEALSRDLPQRQQEALETVIGAIAVVMVTYMIVWMRRHSRDLKGDLESAASAALDDGSAYAFVVMAFLAVLREGLETSVFLVAAFNASDDPVPSASGAILGIAIACALGYGIYRGGVRINLARFFTVTGAVLAVVAAGLVLTAFRTAHEAGWVNVGQEQVVDLTWLVRPGTVWSSIMTGVLGIPAKPVLIEVAAWTVYLVVVGTVVLWPARRKFPRRPVGLALAGFGGVLAFAAAVFLATAPGAPDGPPNSVTAPTAAPVASGILAGHPVVAPRTVTVRITSAGSDQAVGTLRTDHVTTALPALKAIGASDVGDLTADGYQQLISPDLDLAALLPGAPTQVTQAEIIAGNGGRIPVGMDTARFGASAPVFYTTAATVTVHVDPDIHRPVAAEVRYVVTATATPALGAAVVLGKVAEFAAETGDEAVAAVAAAARGHRVHHDRAVVIPKTLLVCAVLATLVALLLAGPRWRLRRRRREPAPPPEEITESGTGVDGPDNIREITQ